LKACNNRRGVLVCSGRLDLRRHGHMVGPVSNRGQRFNAPLRHCEERKRRSNPAITKGSPKTPCFIKGVAFLESTEYTKGRRSREQAAGINCRLKRRLCEALASL
jgi:hypothetical protein